MWCFRQLALSYIDRGRQRQADRDHERDEVRTLAGRTVIAGVKMLVFAGDAIEGRITHLFPVYTAQRELVA